MKGGRWKTSGFAGLISDKSRDRGFPERVGCARLSSRILTLAAVTWPVVEVRNGRAEDVLPWEDHRDDLVYIDGPYQGKTGYPDDCTREAIVSLAGAWDQAGAVVVVSEGEPIDIPGWHHVEVTAAEQIASGKKLAPDKREWLTMNRPPKPLFAGTALFAGLG